MHGTIRKICPDALELMPDGVNDESTFASAGAASGLHYFVPGVGDGGASESHEVDPRLSDKP